MASPKWKEPLPVAKLSRGSNRLDYCLKCGAKIGLSGREPCFDHCRMCGSLWPVRDTPIGEQYRFEISSGLAVHADDDLLHHKFHVKRRYVNSNGKVKPK